MTIWAFVRLNKDRGILLNVRASERPGVCVYFFSMRAISITKKDDALVS